MSTAVKLLLNILLVLNVQTSFQWSTELDTPSPIPIGDLADAKGAYKSGEIQEQSLPITLEKIKKKLKESGIFNPLVANLNERERKELKKLYDAVEIMTTSRNRQPQNVQNMFSSLRMVERVVKKQLKEGQLSETLASKFHWEKLSGRQRRDEPKYYYLDKATKMRVFNFLENNKANNNN